MCSGRPLKMIIPARLPSLVDASLNRRACARLRGLFILRAVPGTAWCVQADVQQVALSLVPGGAHNKSSCVAKTPQVSF